MQRGGVESPDRKMFTGNPIFCFISLSSIIYNITRSHFFWSGFLQRFKIRVEATGVGFRLDFPVPPSVGCSEMRTVFGVASSLAPDRNPSWRKGGRPLTRRA